MYTPHFLTVTTVTVTNSFYFTSLYQALQRHYAMLH